jgi:DNA-binding winged helix-turn-helix (wHTH) protein
MRDGGSSGGSSTGGRGDELIRTVRNEGYMFAADVERR